MSYVASHRSQKNTQGRFVPKIGHTRGLCKDRQTDRQTLRHTENDEYSIVAVDKPQLF